MSEDMDDERLPDMQKRENLIVHIEGLQVTLTKRNERITELESQLSAMSTTDLAQRARDKEFKRGWMACAASLMTMAADAQRELRTLGEVAYREYMKGESIV